MVQVEDVSGDILLTAAIVYRALIHGTGTVFPYPM
jgi:hypothetical protein